MEHILTLSVLPLHGPALLFATALAAMLCGTLLLLMQVSTPGGECQRIWGLSMGAAAFGFMIAALGWDVPWLAVGLGNTILLGAAALAWEGARLFAGRQGYPLATGAGPLAAAVLIPVLPEDIWLALVCTLGAGYSFAAAFELARLQDEPLPSRAAAVLLLWFHGAVFTARAAATALFGASGQWDAPLGMLVTIEGMLFAISMTVLLLALLKERVESRARQEMLGLALSDGLTGIGNRRRFDLRLQHEVDRARRDNSSLALMVIDIDHFTLFNDTFGAARGDTCLKDIAFAIARFARRPADLAARYEGAAFAILLPSTDIAGAVDVAEGVRQAVAALNIPAPVALGRVTVSIGVAATPPGRDDKSADSLLARADAALHEAKNAGRNKVRAGWEDARSDRTEAG